MKITEEEIEFLKQSNWIEEEFRPEAMKGAINAWMFACKKRMHPPSVHYIEKIHEELMMPIRKDIAGKLRTCAVRIGGQVKQKEPPAMIANKLRKWIKQYWSYAVERHIQEAHVAFEAIHPFEDGNGRVGRILMNIMRINAGYPVLIINQSERDGYYEWFRSKEEIERAQIKREYELDRILEMMDNLKM